MQEFTWKLPNLRPLIISFLCLLCWPEWPNRGETKADDEVVEKARQHLSDFLTAYPQLHSLMDWKIVPDFEGYKAAFNEFELEDTLSGLLGRQRVKDILKVIDEELAKEGKYIENEKRQIIRLISDIILFSALTPVQKLPVGNGQEILEYSLAPITMKKSENLLQEIAASIHKEGKIRPEGTFSLGHLSESRSHIPYFELNVRQRMFLMSLSHLKTPHLREEIEKDGLFLKIFKSPHLSEWMLASSGSLGQDYMNSCVSASINQEVLVHSSSIISLIILAQKVLESISAKGERLSDSERKAKAFKGLVGPPSKETYLKRILEDSKKNLEGLYGQAMKADQHQDKLKLKKEIRQLTQVWSKIMQDLSAVSNPVDPVYLTARPLKNHWALSGVMMLIPSLVGPLVPGFPTLMDRYEGIDMRAFRTHLSAHIDGIQVKSSQFLMDNLQLGRKFKEIKSQLGKEGEDLFLRQFWEEVRYIGGLVLDQNESHTLFLRAGMVDGQYVFFVGDPKRVSYQILRPSEFSSFLLLQSISIPL